MQKKNHGFKNYQPPEKFLVSELFLKNHKLCRFLERNSVFVQKKKIANLNNSSNDKN